MQVWFYLTSIFKRPKPHFSGMALRNSVPRQPDMKAEEMRSLIDQLLKNAEKWNAIKLVVLGNGRIGKTTLLHSINNLLTPSPQEVCFCL